jgi:hypothetical protein
MNQDQRELLEALFWPVRCWLAAVVMGVDAYLEMRRQQRGEGRPMTKGEHERRFGNGRADRNHDRWN